MIRHLAIYGASTLNAPSSSSSLRFSLPASSAPWEMGGFAASLTARRPVVLAPPGSWHERRTTVERGPAEWARCHSPLDRWTAAARVPCSPSLFRLRDAGVPEGRLGDERRHGGGASIVLWANETGRHVQRRDQYWGRTSRRCDSSAAQNHTAAASEADRRVFLRASAATLVALIA